MNVLSWLFKTKEQRLIESAFKKYVSPELLREFEVSEQAQYSVNVEYAGVVVSLNEYYDYSNSADVNEFINAMNEYWDETTCAILQTSGMLDKYYQGDCIAIYRGSKSNILQSITKLHEQLALRNIRGSKTLNVSIGAYLGDAIIGNFGSRTRKNYSVVGKAINVANEALAMGKSQCMSIILASNDIYEIGFDKSIVERDGVYYKIRNIS